MYEESSCEVVEDGDEDPFFLFFFFFFLLLTFHLFFAFEWPLKKYLWIYWGYTVRRSMRRFTFLFTSSVCFYFNSMNLSSFFSFILTKLKGSLLFILPYLNCVVN